MSASRSPLSRAAPTNVPIDLTTIGIPTLLLAGEQGRDAVEPERLAAAITGARLVRVPGDHMTAVKNPAFSSALVDFLSARPADHLTRVAQPHRASSPRTLDGNRDA